MECEGEYRLEMRNVFVQLSVGWTLDETKTTRFLGLLRSKRG
jgi:hypothetical protein